MNREQEEVDKWFASDGGKSCCNPVTLKLPPESSPYLHNRIWKAYIAGMDAGRIIEKEEVLARWKEMILRIKS